MEGAEDVRELDDTHVHWQAEIGGVTREWEAEIVAQMPGQQLAWRGEVRPGDGATGPGALGETGQDLPPMR